MVRPGDEFSANPPLINFDPGCENGCKVQSNSRMASEVQVEFTKPLADGCINEDGSAILTAVISPADWPATWFFGGSELAASENVVFESNNETGERKLLLKNGANFVSLAFKVSIVADSVRSSAIVTFPEISFTKILEDQAITPEGKAFLEAVISPPTRATTWFFGKSPFEASDDVEIKEDKTTGERSLKLLKGRNFVNLSFQIQLRDDKTGVSTGCCLTVPPLDYPPYGLSDSVRQLPEWIQLGCGNSEYYCEEKNATFLGANVPAELPDLEAHNSFFSEAIKANPALYASLKDKKTSSGVTLGHCIKTGIDNPGHPHIKTVGMVAGDEESYTLFKDLFDPVISARHNGYAADATHPTNLNVEKLSKTPIDPTGQYVLTTRCRTGRSVRGFRLPPCLRFEERRKLESAIVKSLKTLKGSLEGDYFPLHGSRSYSEKPSGMSLEKEEELRSNGNLFQEPDSTLLLSSGCGRHWPDARGIYHNNDRNLFVWVNEEDHMRIVSMEKGDNVRKIIQTFADATKAIQNCLQEQGFDFMHNDHLGWLLTCPSNLGTGLRAGAMVKVPLFSARPDFKDILKQLGLQARGGGGVDSDSVGGIWDISNADRLGKSEISLVNTFIEGIAKVIAWERKMEIGESIDENLNRDIEKVQKRLADLLEEENDQYPPTGLSKSVRQLPEWIQLGCGDEEYNCPQKNATFLGAQMPDTLPDLSKHNSFFSEAMNADPGLYDRLKSKKTAAGVTLGHCIKTGIDNPGHPHIKTVGMVAGDEESYETFKELFDPVISARHNGYAYDAKHPTNLNVDQLSQTPIDPTGKYVLTTRCRTGRSVRGFRLPPCLDFEERRKLEGVIVKSLKTLKGSLEGDYFPLHGSRSFTEKPTGMSLAKEEELRSNGNLFQEPDSTLLLSSGCGRHWPDARGIYHNGARNLFVWVNEEDHMRIVSMEKGDNVRKIIQTFADATQAIQNCLQEQGFDFMHSEHLGWILTCPSNLGTGLRAGAMVKVPLFSARPDFKDILKQLGLQARGGGGVDSDSVGGIWDISNADRLGKSEIMLVNTFIEGIAQVIRWEQRLEDGEKIDETLKEDIEKVLLALEDLYEIENDQYPPTGLSRSVRKLPEWIQAGCGDSEYFCEEKNATFLGAAAPEECPDLSKHNSYFSEALKAQPELYAKLKDKKTKLGVTLGHCIKTGIDNPGHPHIKTVGMVAGDEESYSTFRELFDPVISARHNGYEADALHPTNLDVDYLSTTTIDPDGNYVLTSRCRTGRSVRGFRLPPCLGFDERRKLEAAIVKSLKTLSGDLEGDYFPLHGSRSYEEKPTGMTLEKEEELRSNGNLFQEPDSTLLLSSGCGRHWPDARGIYHNNNKNLFVWVNEEDHMRIVSMEKGDNVRTIIERFALATKAIQSCLKEQGFDFMHNNHLGWILTCPSNLGTGLRAGAMVKVPLFSDRDDYKIILRKLGLQARGGGGVDSDSVGGIWDISNADRLGKSEISLVNIFIEGVAQIIRWEKRLEQEQEIDLTLDKDIQKVQKKLEKLRKIEEGEWDEEEDDDEDCYPPTGLAKSVRKLPEWIQAGCGDAEYYSDEKGATFSAEKMPAKLPSLAAHNSFFSEAMKANPGLYDSLKSKTTASGVNLGHCIKTGIDNPGHPHIKTVGMVAGDEDSYTVFKDLFDPVISARHNGYAADAKHITNLDVSQLSQTPIDVSGRFVLTTRCRTGRSVRGFKLPPCISFEERRELEAAVTKSLLALEGDLQGDYFPLHGSRSFEQKPTGMSVEKEEELRSNGNLFQEPDSTLLLASGCGRHWPDARGIYHNNDKNLFVWVNEEDHLRIVSMEKGDNVRKIIERFAVATKAIQECLKSQGYDFMHSDHLGWILTCPSNLGTGLRAGAMVQIPFFSDRDDFKEILARLGLQARGGAGVDSDSVGGIWDISNADRLGKSEIMLVNTFIEGVSQVIQWEQRLERGDDITKTLDEDVLFVQERLSQLARKEQLFFTPPAPINESLVYGMAPPDAPFKFLNELEHQTVREGSIVRFEVDLSHPKEVTWLRGRGRCQVGKHYEIIAVGLKRVLVIMGAEWNDSATFTCQTEDGEQISVKLRVVVPTKAKKNLAPVKKKKLVATAQFNEKESHATIDKLFKTDKRPQQLKLKSAQKSGWKGTKPSVKNYLMHDYSVEIEKMYREWDKRKSADNDRKILAAETAEKALENAEVQERLASRLASEFELDRPIKADRGDPFCIQKSDEHRLRVENFVRRINKAYRLAEEVEVEEVFQKSDLEKYMEKLKARNPSYRIEAETADCTRDAVLRLAKSDRSKYDKKKKLERLANNISEMVGMKNH